MENLSKLTIYQIVNDLPERYKPMSIEEQMARKGGTDPSTWDRFVSWLRNRLSFDFLKPCPERQLVRLKETKLEMMYGLKRDGKVTWTSSSLGSDGLDFSGVSPGANWTGNDGYGDEGYSVCPSFGNGYGYP